MSYILDALRRADTERGRGVVPGIHSQMDGPAAASTAPSRNRTLVWAVVGLSAALVVVIAWMLLRGGDAPAPVVAVAPAPAELPPPVAPPPPPAPEPVPTTIVPTTPPPMAAETPRVPPREEAPAPRRPRAEPATQAAQPKPPAAAPSPAPAPKASPATGNTRIYALNELPQDIRGSLPQLSIGGAMYSPNPASRMLIVNGQLMHEGEKVTPELVLDQIELKRAVLSFRGYRYSINY